MKSSYIDTAAIIQIIGTLFNNPNLLEQEDKYHISEEDFQDTFHKIVFGSIYQLWEQGATEINLKNISDFLATRPKSEAIFKREKGDVWISHASKNAIEQSFDYYYSRLKKMSLFRAYEECGLDVSDIYDPNNILDAKKRQEQEDFIDNSSLEQLADIIDKKITSIRLAYIENNMGESFQAGEDIYELIEKLKVRPEVGPPLYGSLVNTVTRGARPGKFYLRSAPTGVGKTRTLIADACNFACDKIYNETLGWISNGMAIPTLFIATEQDLEEVQTMMLAFISNVNEETILTGKYKDDEEQRVLKAAEIISKSPLYIETISDFSLKDIEDTIKKNIRDRNISCCIFDYIHTSMKILEEITRRSGGVKLREDNILFMLSNKIKNICVDYGIFILSATQLNGGWNDAETPDQNLLRGAKAIADKVDVGMILLPAGNDDLEALQSIIERINFAPPNLKLSIYKNRRGRYKGIYLWCNADLGTCRVNPIFATDYNYEFIEMENINIILKDEKCAW